ncbi:MAG TPA: TetR family transcriptional regulator [Acidimicrobiales bacterium]|nr:TetR family transcriptional regulator [Acidimicrobiales bacterium]
MGGDRRRGQARARVRISQAERRAAAQTRLLAAVVDSLAEAGYSGTSTAAVGRRAGVSRGAQLHYYNSKAELLVAALGHVMAEKEEQFRKAMADAEPGSLRIDTAIEVLWSLFQGPVGAAWLELRVAARTNPDLAVELRSLEAGFYRRSAAVFVETVPEAADSGVAPEMQLRFAFAVLDGLGLQTLLTGADPEPAERILDLLKAGARVLLAPDARDAGPDHQDTDDQDTDDQDANNPLEDR